VLFTDKQKSSKKVMIQEMFPELIKDGNLWGRVHSPGIKNSFGLLLVIVSFIRNPALVPLLYPTLKTVLLSYIDCDTFLSAIMLSILFCLCLENIEINN
jgi:hypothetical protein